MDAETHELIAAYALDALDDADRARVEEILATSEEAREELRAYADVAVALATAVSGAAPSPDLRARIADAARAEPQNVVSLDARRRLGAAPVAGIAAALAACAALGLGIWALAVSSDLDDARSALARERATADVLADPSSESSLTGNGGRLVVGDGGRAVLVLANTPAVPSGKTYQMWVIDDGKPASAGLFRARAGTVAVAVGGRVKKGSVVAVTIENDGGAEAPSGSPVIASSPVTLD
jgi:anti-sigma-K factor RskA